MKPGSQAEEKWNVLVVGNNPIELGYVFERLHGIRGRTILTEMAFDLQTILQRLALFRPQHIIIDDNVGQSALHDIVDKLYTGRSSYVPITVLKNSNYQEAIGNGVMNFVLKQNLTSELLHLELLNSLRFFETHQYWNRAYRKRKGQLVRLVKSVIG
jgi:hypothetical protein